MKKFITLFFGMILISVIVSCSGSDGSKKSETTDSDVEKIMPDNEVGDSDTVTDSTNDDSDISTLPEEEFVKDISTFHGNPDGDIVVVNTQGGPITTLEDEILKEFIDMTQTQDALYVNVHQVQTKNPELFTKSDITFDQAKKYDIQSVENLKRVVDYFKNEEGKTVYVLGISFGAFMTQELIAAYGIDAADGYLIMVGRLNIDEETYKPFSQGQSTEYEYDDEGNYTINLLGDGSTAEERNMYRLAAGLGHNRYISRLNSMNDLSKITYVYGNRDEQVGPLSKEEIEFLEGRKAKVIFTENGDHDDAIENGLTILKETFGI